ncbi:MAG: non-homologous end-joining DNA ligase [Acidimicrobiales bacterium]
MADPSLETYRRKRDPARTPEPLPPEQGAAPADRPGAPRFVIQEHHASSLHWDFRLERDGVLVSWALPKGLPMDPAHNRLAVPTEDHPLEYSRFSGTIPASEYGGGKVTIWDQGSYDCEKWAEREVMVVLHGQRVEGRYVLFPTGENWMIHRMDPPPDGWAPVPERLSPMLAVPADRPPEGDDWSYEFKWDGIRVLLWVDGGRVHALTRNGNDTTGSFPELREFGEAVGSVQLLLDGELIALDQQGHPSFSRLQRRMHVTSAAAVRKAAVADPASLVLFDLLHREGRSLLASPYHQRRRELESLGLSGPRWAVTPAFTDEPGSEALRIAAELGMEGVVAKRRDSPYRPGTRSRDWVKVKNQRTQEVVVGGWTPGQGNRRGLFGSLLVGLPVTHRRRLLRYAGKVGTGFTQSVMEDLFEQLRHLTSESSPFDADVARQVGAGVTWVTPTLVGEVRFSEWTPDHRFRHPVWRGIRTDKSPADVVHEP